MGTEPWPTSMVAIAGVAEGAIVTHQITKDQKGEGMKTRMRAPKKKPQPSHRFWRDFLSLLRTKEYLKGFRPSP